MRDIAKKLKIARRIGLIPTITKEDILDVVDGLEDDQSGRARKVVEELGDLLAVFDSLPKLTLRANAIFEELKLRKAWQISKHADLESFHV